MASMDHSRPPADTRGRRSQAASHAHEASLVANTNRRPAQRAEARVAARSATQGMATPRLLVRPGYGAGPDVGEPWPLSRVLKLIAEADALEWGQHAAHELVVHGPGPDDRSVVLMAWHVDSADGVPVYEGLDLTLAYGLSRALPGSHLIPLPAGVRAQTRPSAALDGELAGVGGELR